ncbi:MAG: hypothetical protein N2Z72_08045 [Bacteroidales bacterium]|nr:hypothetical protein [Bacteroidales bacterium]
MYPLVAILLCAISVTLCKRGNMETKTNKSTKEETITGIITTQSANSMKEKVYYFLTTDETFIIEDVINIKCADPLSCFEDHLVEAKVIIKGTISEHKKQADKENYRKIIITKLKEIGIPDSLFISDGSSNTFVFTSHMFQYKPVEASMSSSGYYSGGEPVEKAIDKLTFQMLTVKAYSFMQKTSLHLTQRLKGCITITIVFKNHTETCFLKSSQSLEEFLNELHSLKK